MVRSATNHQGIVREIYTLRPKKNISDIFDCNLKTNYHMLINFGINVPDTICYKMIT